ncbi:DUF3006 family protein [Pseudobacteroides cellulosolvens]|uniref:Uncharacterized protein n=1 Tax=Pseudobacteroides cellulosolvens ATCC 35603 = DSM 2933 TaxID=398512 RepID=A0A0L6JHB5_9FIRM|nr:DUF3006 family protein [Pseudobacteroides cellulosolvens]KNY25221.1 Protein of unknown function DUF3006 [Pseudobacteroides cellulosolvens ATCC 35603 = DSM 2933]
MEINAVVDRIENGNAVLLSEDMGIEISIPEENIINTYHMGDRLTLTINGDFDIRNA